jgi:hypothetical protein
MSTIGGTTAAGLNLAGSIVGSSRPEAVSDHNNAARADQKSQIDRDITIKEGPDGISDPQFSKDRDADGRQMYHSDAAVEDPADQPDEGKMAETGGAPLRLIHATDAFGDRGNALDIDA